MHRNKTNCIGIEVFIGLSKVLMAKILWDKKFFLERHLFLTHVESATATETKLFGNSCTVKRNSQIVQSNYLI